MELHNFWFTSDPHYFHVRALEIMPYRPWKTLKEMNDGLKENYNNLVSPDDIVFFLGDVVMGVKGETVPQILPYLNGKKFLVRGNHDGGFQVEKGKQIFWDRLYLNNDFINVFDGLINLNQILDSYNLEIPIQIDLCHFPYEGTPDHEGYDRKFYDIMPKETDNLLLHGHTHSRVQRTSPKMIHIGVDSWDWKPVNLTSVLELYHQ